ncbi:MAG TPA: FG-GAP-like repeat-containing protein [Nocardioidaceae bacterium]|nr:FG-GAP-like repeat-containing protein [Nocardioidaceae bacterium]
MRFIEDFGGNMARSHVGTRLLLAGTLAVGAPALMAAPAVAAGAAFHPYVAYDPGSDPANVAVGDVTGDGRPDVLMTTEYYFDEANDYKLWVYPQQTDGTLGAPTRLDTGATYGSEMAIGVADLDGDGDLDAAVTTQDGVDLFVQQDGALVRSWTVPIPEGRDLSTVDVNDDDLADLVVNTDNGLRVWWQVNGDFMPSPQGASFGTGAVTEIETGDVTGDGLADIVGILGQTVEVRVQQPDHGFAAPVAYPVVGANETWNRANGLALGDLNADGLDDIAVTAGGNRPNSTVETRLQGSDGTLGAATVLASYDVPEPAEIADVTGDGRADLVVAHGGWNTVGVYEQTTSGTLYSESRFTVPYASHYRQRGLAVGDVTGDGRADVLLADYNNGLVLLRNAAPGTDILAPDTVITAGPSGSIQTRGATFSFQASEPSTFACSIDGGPWLGCASPKTYAGLTDGAHTFRVRATDTAGNTDTSPAQRTVVVEGPDTTITSGPTGAIRSTSATFGFSGAPGTTGFHCALDNGAWTACSSPTTYTGLQPGTSHTFRVRAYDDEGIVDPTPASRGFSIDVAADLAVAMTASSTTVKRGGTLTYRTTVTNLGGATATGVTLTQTLPSGVSLGSVATSTGSCTTSGAPATVRCTIATVAPGVSVTLTITVTVAVSKGTLNSTGVASADTWDPASTNNTATTAVKVGSGK